MRKETGQTIQLAEYRPTNFVLERVDLTFELDPTETKVESRLIFHRRSGVDANEPLVLDGDGLSLAGLLLDQSEVPAEQYTVTPESLLIRNLPQATPFEITVTTIINPEANTELMGLYRSNGIYCTQCEAEGFRRITYFPDRPDVLAPYTVNIIADKAPNPLLLSNGNFLGGAGFGPDKHFAAWFDPHPKPSYLFALVAGDLGVVEDTFTTLSGREVALKIYVEHGKEPRATYAMDALKRSMKWDEEVFGREYDLDVFMIVAVSDFNMGAMENKGLNIFNDKYVLADPETATDADYANIEAIIAHEYFHNWTGNRITCRDWFQLCLKEGLTVYRDHEFSADQRSRAVKRIAEVRHLKAEQFAEDAGPLAHPVRPTAYREINNFYTSTVYEKGSEVTRMIATILGRDGFKKGMDLYFERHDGDAATVEDFVKCFEDANKADLSQFSLWYHQAGTPVVSVEEAWNAASETLTLTLGQTVPPTPGQPYKKPMHIPIRLGILTEEGEDVVPTAVSGADFTGDVLHLTGESQVVTLSGIKTRPVLSLNRSFSAPINLKFAQSAEDQALIAGHESDLFARWQAINTLALKDMAAGVAALSKRKAVKANPSLVSAVIRTARDGNLEPAFRALALTLPGESDLFRELRDNNDPDRNHQARRAVLTAIAKSGKADLEAILKAMSLHEPFSPDAAGAGKRALANSALSFLALAEEDPARAAEAFEKADNMTVLIHALSVLAHHFPTATETAKALAAFETRFADNALVMDKWFSAQATIPGADALDRVKALQAHRLYNNRNPNRIRALVGAFSMANPTGFNRADGEGYRFLAGEILSIDPKNPQLAARLLTAMRSWQMLEPGRREKAGAALKTIQSAGNLSADVKDIVDRMLAA